MASSRVHGRGLRSSALPFWHWFSQVSLRHFVFVRHIKSGIVVLTVYVNILLTDVIQLGYWRPGSILSAIM